MRRSPFLWIGGAIVTGVALTAALAPLLAPYDPHAVAGPSLAAPSGRFLLGTNDVGQDILSQLIWGARSAVVVAGLAAVLALVVGVLVGATAVLVRPFEPAKKPATAASIGPLEIRAVSVSAELRSPVCLLVGIVTTNGQPGRVVYRWVGENGSQAVTSVSTPADNYQIEIGMIWAPSSPPLHGSSITLQILEPKPSTTAAPVPLSCI